MLPVRLPGMASIRRKAQSQFWFACFTLPDGTRTQRSTKETNRRKAQRLAEDYESATRARLTARQAQKVIADIHQRVTGDALPTSTVRMFFDSWLSRKALEISPASRLAYTALSKRFIAWLGERAELEVAQVSPRILLAFRQAESERVAAPTVNNEIKKLRMVFEQARRDGYTAENPAESIKPLRSADGSTRRGFTLQEVQTLIRTASDEEWRSLIAFGFYTGQRLGDLAALTWQNLDLQRRELRFVTRKTGRRQILKFPQDHPFWRHVENLPVSDDPKQPLHPKAFAAVCAGKTAMLSRQFYEVMADAGLVKAKEHRKGEKALGRAGKRELSEISFHSLRHSATSFMKIAGASAAVVQDLIGHESDAISANYTHIDEEAKSAALGTLPDIFRSESKPN